MATSLPMATATKILNCLNRNSQAEVQMSIGRKEGEHNRWELSRSIAIRPVNAIYNAATGTHHCNWYDPQPFG